MVEALKYDLPRNSLSLEVRVGFEPTTSRFPVSCPTTPLPQCLHAACTTDEVVRSLIFVIKLGKCVTKNNGNLRDFNVKKLYNIF